MTTPFSRIERARSDKRVTPLTLIGLLLVPFVIAGLLVWALWSPTDRLDTVKAAFVNNDEPVTVDGQTVPLGRQLGSALVKGGTDDDADSDMNYDWVVTDADDAAAGLADGTYAAVVTVPENFSEAATSMSGDADDAEQAVIDVTMGESGKLLDDALSQVITTTAASVMSTTLTETYLDNVLLGFTTLNENLGDAADGAGELADGSSELADGTSQAADGAGELADNSSTLTDGADQLADGAGELADGAATYADGVSSYATGAHSAADGASQLADGASSLAGGLQTLVDGLGQLKEQTTGLGQLGDAAAGVAQTTSGLIEWLNAADTYADQCSGGDAVACGTLAAIVSAANDGDLDLSSDDNPTIDWSEVSTAATAVTDNAGKLGQLESGIASMVDADTNGNGVADIQELPQGASDLATGASDLSSGVSQLATGADQLSSGASSLSDGASQLASGTSEFATGLATYTGGVVSLADAMDQLSDGTGELSDGTKSLADGLDDAVDQIPSYTDDEAEKLSTVASDPVAASTGEDGWSFGSSGFPFYASIALWLGALATFFVLRALPSRTLGSTRSPLALALRSAWPGLALGVLQGLVVGVIVSIAQELSVGGWFGMLGLSAVVGVVFAAVNQALVAVLGGTGRFVSMIIGVVALAAGIVSTVPGFLQSLAGVLPTSPAREALAAVAGTGSAGGAIVALLLWLVGSLLVTTLSIALRRTVGVRGLRRASPSPA